MSTMKVKSSHPKSQGPFVVIDAADFDPKKHVEYAPEKAEGKKAKEDAPEKAEG
jgi:hypothetical protein